MVSKEKPPKLKSLRNNLRLISSYTILSNSFFIICVRKRRLPEAAFFDTNPIEMELQFFKYQGTGNDFILIDNRDGHFHASTEQIAFLCHRRFGIGADGLICLALEEGYDFKMVYYNADGRESTMCGNGGRCLVRFAHDLGVIQNTTRFLAVDGPHDALVSKDVISLKMMDVVDFEQQPSHFFLQTGSPHYVTFVDSLAHYPVASKGAEIRYSPEWVSQGGTNVNFVEKQPDQSLFVRTYERGVEDETLSCGTGVTACALATHLAFGWPSPVAIQTLGGSLSVAFERTPQGFDQIYLTGPAKRVFVGNISLP